MSLRGAQRRGNLDLRWQVTLRLLHCARNDKASKIAMLMSGLRGG